MYTVFPEPPIATLSSIVSPTSPASGSTTETLHVAPPSRLRATQRRARRTSPFVPAGWWMNRLYATKTCWEVAA
jgi:hypothetical protein